MSKKYICILISLLISSFVCAETSEGILKLIKDKSSSVKSIVADFQQVKSSAYISKDIKTDGKFYYLFPDKVCLKNDEDNYLLMNGENFVISTGGDKMAANNKSNPMVSNLGNLLKSCVTGDFASIVENKKNQLKVEETLDRYILTITLAGSAKRFFSEVELIYFKHDASLEKLKMVEKNGDSTVYTFSNHKFNMQIDNSVFKIN